MFNKTFDRFKLFNDIFKDNDKQWDPFDEMRNDMFRENDKRWEALKEKGNNYFREKKYEEALKCYNQAININNNIEILHSNKGTCEKCLQNFKEAELEYLKAIKLNPSKAKNFSRLSSIYLIMGELSEAYTAQKKAMKFDPNNLSYKQQLEKINEMINEDEEINKLLKQNNYDEIEKKYQDLISKNQEFMYLKKKYIYFLFDIIKYKEASAFLNEQISNNIIKKTNEEFIFIACLSLYYNGQYKTAENAILGGLKNLNEKKHDDLLYKIRNLEPVKKKGNDLYEQKNYEEAIQVYTKALELDPQNKKYNSIILVNRALCFQKLEKYKAALNDANQSLKLNPNYSRAYVKRAIVHLKLKNFKAAVEDFEKAKKIDPNSQGIEGYLQDLNKQYGNLENELNLEKSRKDKLIQEVISLKNIINVKNNEINNKDDIIYDLKKKIKDMQNALENSYENKKVMELMEKLVKKEENLKKMENEIKEMKSRYPFELNNNEVLMTVNIMCLSPKITLSIICKNTHKFIYLENVLYEKYPELTESENYFIFGGIKINKFKTLEENGIKDNDIISLERIDNDDDNFSIDPFVSKMSKDSISSKKSNLDISRDSIISKDSFNLKDSLSSCPSFSNLFSNEKKDNHNGMNDEKIYYNSKFSNDIDN